MARNDGRRPKMSGQTSAAAVAPAGWTKCASQVPSGVLISTSDSVTSAAAAIVGNMAAKLAAKPKLPNWRREISFPRRISSFESCSHMADPGDWRDGRGILAVTAVEILAVRAGVRHDGLADVRAPLHGYDTARCPHPPTHARRSLARSEEHTSELQSQS